jgi:hypothetical protein
MTAGPPPRPSTTRMTAPPIAAVRDQPRPRVVTVSCWLWLVAGALAVAAVLVTLTRLDAMRAELARVAGDSDPSDMVGRVVDLSVVVIVGGGLGLGVLGGLLALRLRAGRGWARVTLIALTLLVVVYAVLVASATGWLVLVYAAVTVAAGVCMYLPGAGRWFL